MRFKPSLVTDNTHATFKKTKPCGTAQLAVFTGPKIRIKTGVWLLHDRLSGFGVRPEDAHMFCHELIGYLSPEQQAKIIYPREPRPEIMFPYGAWLELREAFTSGPWPSPNALETELNVQAEKFKEICRTLAPYVSFIRIHFKLLIAEEEHMPAWWDAWLENKKNITLSHIPNWRKLMQR